METYNTLKVLQKDPGSPVFHLLISGPPLRNALPPNFFPEFIQALSSLDQNPNVSVIIICGNGGHFCTGIDVRSANSPNSDLNDRGRLSEKIRRDIRAMQAAITAIEHCRKPVIAAIHGACIGAGVDMVTACDIRLCSDDAFFSVKEVDLGITADFGTLQRLPGIIGYGHAMELAMTARRFSASEAKSLGLISMVFESRDALDEGARRLADVIAGKPPLAVIGTKAVMQRSRDLSVEEGLDFVSTWNCAMLLSHDTKEAIAAQMHKRNPLFAKL